MEHSGQERYLPQVARTAAQVRLRRHTRTV
jgi:hypothetical protein